MRFFSLITFTSLLGGIFVGYNGFSLDPRIMDWLLLLLISTAGFLIGRELHIIITRIREIGVISILITITTVFSSLIGGLIAVYIIGGDWRIGATIGAASGWYSLVGPLVSQIDPLYGLIGFLANLLRETFHIVLYPFTSRCYRIASVSIGGATTMDTGLPVIVAYGNKDAVLVGMIQGGLITLLSPILLPLILGI